MTVELVGQITVADGTERPDEAIERHLDLVMDELETLDARDPSISVDLADGEVTMSVVVEAANPVDAVGLASGLLRTAIHAAGGATPDWPEPFHEAWAIRLTGVQSVVTQQDARQELAGV